MYEVVIENRAKRQIKSLPQNDLSKIIGAILDLKKEPKPGGVKKLADKPYFRIRVGSYRVLYTIDESKKLVTVFSIAHRKEIYRNV